MKQLLTIILLFIGLSGFGQIKFRLNPNAINTSSTGGVINRGDYFYVYVQANGNGNSTSKQLLFDLQYDLTNFTLQGVTCTGTGGNGGVLPQNSNPTISYYDYNGYSFIANTANTTTNGTTNYQQSNYVYNANNASSIVRATLTWSSTAAMPYGSYDNIIILKFQLKPNSTAYTFNPVKLNFVASWNKSGQFEASTMETPLSQAVIMNQNFGKYVTANIDLNSNLYNLSALKLSFRDTATNIGQLFNVNSTGTVDINQSLLADNKVYEVSLMHNIDNTYAIYNSAITISDFTTAQQEFTQNGLTVGGGQLGNILQTGQSFYAADINRNKSIDGGDLPRLLGQVAGLDTLITIPSGYTIGSNGYMSLPTWKAADVMTVGGQVEWAYVSPGSSYSTLYIDMRKFPTGTLPNTIKSIQLFDLYTGPIEYLSEDATWAQYKIPSTFSKAGDGTSNFQPYIRKNNGDYNLRAEFAFDVDPGHSWGNITTSNWTNITYPRTYFKTSTLGTNAILDLKYLLWGDVNRSHSSQVVTTSGGTSTVQTNAVNSLQTNTAFTTMASNTGFINTSTREVSSIDVNLSNITVTSNNIEIPISIDAKGNNVSGLQFQFAYDPNKIKFEELVNNIPNTWYTFVNAKEGIVKFGSLDQANKTPITGTSTPFKLKFSTIGNGVDILTSVKISPIMDASSSNGTQLGINLNITTIKLTGYNNF
jgi:hypothetical protein